MQGTRFQWNFINRNVLPWLEAGLLSVLSLCATCRAAPGSPPPPNNPPVISSPAEIALVEDTLATCLINVSDDRTPTDNIRLEVRSLTPSLIPDSRIDLSRLANGWELGITPATNCYGSALIQIVATDAGGASTTNFVATNIAPVNDPPTVALVSPLDGSVYPPGSPVPIAASASDVDDPIDQVRFLVDGVLIGAVRSPPYAFSWSDTTSGDHLLTSVAVESGASALSSTSAPVRITVSLPPNRAPIITANPAIIVTSEDTASVPIQVTITDDQTAAADLKVVASSLAPGLLGESGITLSRSGNVWSLSVLPLTNAVGLFMVRVVATDAQGLATTIVFPVTVTPVNDPPVVAITSPVAATVFASGATVLITATAADVDSPLVKVEFFADGTSIFSVVTPPYSVHWNGATTGDHGLVATATDGEGLTSSSAEVRITVAPRLNRPPVISLDEMSVTTDQDTESGALHATITDDQTVAASIQVVCQSLNPEFLSNSGITLKRTNSVWSLTISSLPNAFGAGLLRLIATDSDGDSSTNVIPFTVRHVSHPPVVRIVNPADFSVSNYGEDIQISADVTDRDQDVAAVDLFVDGAMVAHLTAPPWGVLWPATQLGQHRVRAMAQDATGLAAVTTDVIISVVVTNILVLASPRDTFTLAGLPVTLDVQAIGPLPLNFQWSHNHVPIFNATNATLRLSAAQPGDSGLYSVAVSDGTHADRLAVANVTISVPDLLVVKRPEASVVDYGEQAVLAVEISGYGPLQFQWYKDQLLLANQTNAALVIYSPTTQSSGIYQVNVRDLYGHSLDLEASLAVRFSPPRFGADIADQTVPEFASTHFDVSVSGIPAPVFRWLHDGNEIRNETNSILSLPRLSPTNAGLYQCIASNAIGTTEGKVARMVVRREFDRRTVNGEILLLAYLGRESLVDIPTQMDGLPVTQIAARAFLDCGTVTSVRIPDGVRSIGVDAFRRCNRLQSALLPDGVEAVESGAFLSCPSLRIFRFPQLLRTVGTSSFSGSGLESVVLPPLLASVGDAAFADCTHLTNVVIPSSVVSIGAQAFSSCNGIVSITLGNGLVTLGDLAFYSAGPIETIMLPKSLKSYGRGAFSRCGYLQWIDVESGSTNFRSADGVLLDKSASTILQYPCGRTGPYSIPSGVSSIASRAFLNAEFLTSVGFPSGLTNIMSLAFHGCIRLREISLPDSVTDIGANAFYLCESLSVAHLGSGVRNIGDQAFGWAGSLSRITVPDSLILLGDRPFEHSTALTEIYFLGDAPVFTGPLTSTSGPLDLYVRPGRMGWGSSAGGFPTRVWDVNIDPASLTGSFANAVFDFRIRGASGLQFCVENLSALGTGSWIPGDNIVLGDSPALFSDHQAIATSARFYRVRPPN